MQFVYFKDASKESIKIDGEIYRYIIKVRRFKLDDIVKFRNLNDKNIYFYKIAQIDKKEVYLTLVDKDEEKTRSLKSLHLLWCMIDPKVIEKTLPMLNQIGVKKISFIYCQRSQKNFRLDMDRVKKILINSSQQCGRGSVIEVEVIKSLDEALKLYNDFVVLDFGGVQNYSNVSKVLIGCEGGFSPEEKIILKDFKKIGFNTDFVLKSETAAVTISSKLLI